MSTPFRFVILAGGQGTRLTLFPRLHKALVPLQNRPAISHILQNVPEDVEVIVSLGNLAEQIRSYLAYVYPDRKITCVPDDTTKGQPGPAMGLRSCQSLLSGPFVFTSVDTILGPGILHAAPTETWLGVDKLKAVTYACASAKLGLTRIEVPPIFIGIAGVANPEDFFQRLGSAAEVTEGFHDYQLKQLPWTDVGADATYLAACGQSTVPLKKDQVTFIDNGRVVKFFADPERAARVAKRGDQFVKGTTQINELMVGYLYVEGLPYSELGD